MHSYYQVCSYMSEWFNVYEIRKKTYEWQTSKHTQQFASTHQFHPSFRPLFDPFTCNLSTVV